MPNWNVAKQVAQADKPKHISDLSLIKESEGLEIKAYLPTPNDVWTIGYGHTSGVFRGMTISRLEAEEFLVKDVKWVEEAINKHVKVPLTQNQFDALGSFVYNLGETNFRNSTLPRVLNAGNYAQAAEEFLRWDKQKGVVLRGLTIRRRKERELFLK